MGQLSILRLQPAYVRQVHPLQFRVPVPGPGPVMALMAVVTLPVALP